MAITIRDRLTDDRAQAVAEANRLCAVEAELREQLTRATRQRTLAEGIIVHCDLLLADLTEAPTESD